MGTMTRIGMIGLAVFSVGLAPRAEAQTVYVATNGTHDAGSNFDSWGGAATNINEAVALANTLGRNVLIGDGVFKTTNTLLISAAYSVQSVNGRDVTTIQRNSSAGDFSVMTVSNASALVAGVTVSGGNAGTASGISIYGGTVSNVTVRNCDLLKAVYIQNALLTGSVVSNNLRDAVVIGPNGIVQDSLIANNRADLNGYATPVAIDGSGALMNRCRVLNNYGIGSWGRYANAFGVYLGNGTLRNTLVAGNINNDRGNKPGGVLVAGGTMENCTITANTNTSDSTVGKGVNQTGGTIRNCIIYGNGGSLTASDYTSSGGSITYSLAPSLTSGTSSSNLNINPLFTGTEYQLATASPCRDTGTNIAAVTTDIAGTARPQSGGTRAAAGLDMGAWEMNGTSGAFDVGFYGDPPLSGLNSLTVTFRPNAVGSDTNVTWYGWDFDNDGGYDSTGVGMPVASYTFGPGLYTVVLRASNGLGETASFTNANCVSVVGSELYVATNAWHQFPFDTWTKAATNIHNAMDAAVGGCTVSISNGTFLTTKQIVLSSGVRVQGVGRNATVLQYSAGNGVLQLAHSNAFATALTVKGGTGGIASGIDITAGIASNVAVVGCGTPRAVSVAGGMMVDSIITNNTYGVNVGANGTLESCVVSNNAQYASGDYVPVVVNGSGAMVNRCRVIGNYSPGGAGRYLDAFGVRLGAGTLRNTLVARNINQDAWTQSNPGPGGVLVAGGTMENCTITANTNYTTATGGKGVYQTGGTIRNCIIYGNGGSAVTGDYTSVAGTIAYSCAPELTNGVSGNITNAPQFVAESNGNFRLLRTSPCLNAGTNQAWMTSALDLDGQPRIRQSRVDMGPYELAPALGTILELR